MDRYHAMGTCQTNGARSNVGEALGMPRCCTRFLPHTHTHTHTHTQGGHGAGNARRKLHLRMIRIGTSVQAEILSSTPAVHGEYTVDFDPKILPSKPYRELPCPF